ncbi:zeta toxin family protein [Paenactinomyces guangxiensis]|uniref:UDP-N-acetylglucosamine kinase n=1 Tax=Paenactinomyces guangxiensis TaxID=1490290 RepID=A0A7W1WQD0_9BACL|nr:zeta toxin family protein [Paenactinomyces guangxiensis]MBA4493978.1 zeta toxin family protein [Paenactinomyces guangxiensis]MBH8593399.1 zeta toxin family protein [Paenactinomyces guangxiensis]
MSRSNEQIYRKLSAHARLDVAIEMMAFMSAQIRKELRLAKAKQAGSEEMAGLKAKREILARERQMMYLGDEAMIRKAIVEYGEQIKEKFKGKARDFPTYKLPAMEHDAVFAEIQASILDPVRPVGQPAALILGGQPGSGKAGLIRIPVSELKDGNVAIINGDEFREDHPYSKEILKKHEQDYAKLTDPDVREWTKRLFDLAIETRRNIIFEGTMRNAGPICNTLDRLIREGYKVIIRVMAVNEKDSLLAVFERYEGQKATKGAGRIAPRSSHEAAYSGMLHTVERIEKEKLFHILQVYNRDYKLLYENRMVNDKHQHSPDAVRAIREERDKEWTPEKTEQYYQKWEQVISMMKARKADPEETTDVIKIINEFLSRE